MGYSALNSSPFGNFLHLHSVYLGAGQLSDSGKYRFHFIFFEFQYSSAQTVVIKISRKLRFFLCIAPPPSLFLWGNYSVRFRMQKSRTFPVDLTGKPCGLCSAEANLLPTENTNCLSITYIRNEFIN